MRIPTIFLLACTVAASACGSSASRPPRTSPEPTVVAPVIERARAAMAAGRLVEAVTLFEQLTDATTPAAERQEALEAAAFIRASAHPGLRDLRRARQWLAERRAMAGPPARALEMATLSSLIEDLGRFEEELRARLLELDGVQDWVKQFQLETKARAETSSRELRALKAAATALQAQIEKLHQDLKQRDDALKRIAATVVGGER
jgi:chromosome segregation ATPase